MRFRRPSSQAEHCPINRYSISFHHFDLAAGAHSWNLHGPACSVFCPFRHLRFIRDTSLESIYSINC